MAARLAEAGRNHYEGALEDALVGQEPGCQHQALAWHQQAGRRRAFEHRRGEDDQIAPVAQPGDQIECFERIEVQRTL